MATHPAPAGDWLSTLRTASHDLTERAARVADACDQPAPPLDAIATELGQLMSQAQTLRARVNVRAALAGAAQVGMTQARIDFAALAAATARDNTVTYLTRRGRRLAALVSASDADGLAAPETIDVVTMEHMRVNFRAAVMAAHENGRCTIATRSKESNRYVAIVPVELVEAAGGKEQ